jgi:hypothetical protein
VAQRICQQDGNVTLNRVKPCKETPASDSDRTNTNRVALFHAHLTRLWGSQLTLVDPVFRLLFSPTTLSLACGKPCGNLWPGESPHTKPVSSLAFDTRLLTGEQPFSTLFEQACRRRHWSQPFCPQGDSKRTDDNHQNLLPLLSSETVIKYSSHTERGRTTTPRFKRTAP